MAANVAPLAGHVARLTLALADLVELPPSLYEAIGSPGRVGADFGFKVERADGAVDLARRRLMDQLRSSCRRLRA